MTFVTCDYIFIIYQFICQFKVKNWQPGSTGRNAEEAPFRESTRPAPRPRGRAVICVRRCAGARSLDSAGSPANSRSSPISFMNVKLQECLTTLHAESFQNLAITYIWFKGKVNRCPLQMAPACALTPYEAPRGMRQLCAQSLVQGGGMALGPGPHKKGVHNA